MKTVQINNCDFPYVEEGDGNSVVLVHGSISDYRTWDNQITVFGKQFHTIAYSRRYHYPSPSKEITSDYTVTQHSNDLAAFIEALNLGSVNLIGSSYGAYISLMNAIKHPDQINSLVLCEPPLLSLLVSNMNNPFHVLSLLIRNYSAGKSFLKFGVKAMFPATKQLRKGNLKEGVRLFSNGVLGPGGFEKKPGHIKEKMLDNATALKAELLGPGFSEFQKKDTSKLNVPVLLVCGEKSPAFFRSISDKLHSLLPKSQQVIIPDASHNMHEANPAVYNEEVLNFLVKHNYD